MDSTEQGQAGAQVGIRTSVAGKARWDALREGTGLGAAELLDAMMDAFQLTSVPATGDYAGMLRAVSAAAEQAVSHARAIAAETDAAGAAQVAALRADYESRCAALQAERDQLAERIAAAEALEEADARLRDQLADKAARVEALEGAAREAEGARSERDQMADDLRQVRAEAGTAAAQLDDARARLSEVKDKASKEVDDDYKSFHVRCTLSNDDWLLINTYQIYDIQRIIVSCGAMAPILSWPLR